MIRELSNETKQLLNASFQLKSPLSIAKELLDNAIDAKATEIDIKITHNSVEIFDNGPGFSLEILQNLTKTRLTTKSTSQIGFRGEALYAISTLSNLKIESNRKKLENQQITPTTTPNTIISATQIFKNIPVRKAFFENSANWKSEIKLNFKIFFAYSLSFPISLRIWLDNEVKFSTGGVKTQRERFFQLFSLRDNFVDLEVKTDNFTVKGFLSSAFQQVKTSNLFVFVNGKYVENEEIYQVLQQEFKRKSAVFKVNGCVNVEIVVERVDFNVSNDKLTVKMMGYQGVLGGLRDGYRRCLEECQEVDVGGNVQVVSSQVQREIVSQSVKAEGGKPRIQLMQVSPVRTPICSSSQGVCQGVGEPVQKLVLSTPVVQNRVFKEKIQSVKLSPSKFSLQAEYLNNVQKDERGQGLQQQSQSKAEEIAGDDTQVSQKKENFHDFSFDQSQSQSSTQEEILEDNLFNLTYIGQYNSSFLLCHKQHQLYILDQHALEEAIIYESLVQNVKDNLQVQKLITPQELDLDPNQIFLLKNTDISQFNKYGFSIVAKDNKFYLQNVPILDKNVLTKEDFVEYLNQLNENQFPPAFQRILANRSCKTAIKLGDIISDSTAKKIIHRAQMCQNVLNCPHGRPTIFRIK